MAPPTRVALALGSGGARGYAHIGVIEVLEERGLDVVSVAGSSMGALVGGVHAAGRLETYAAWARSLRQRDVVRLLDVSLSAAGAIRADKVLARVRDLLGGVRIEDLPIPFTAVATDLAARKEVWFQHGPVDVAIRASIAIPGVVTPVVLNARLLADGGVMTVNLFGRDASFERSAQRIAAVFGEAQVRLFGNRIDVQGADAQSARRPEGAGPLAAQRQDQQAAGLVGDRARGRRRERTRGMASLDERQHGQRSGEVEHQGRDSCQQNHEREDFDHAAAKVGGNQGDAEGAAESVAEHRHSRCVHSRKVFRKDAAFGEHQRHFRLQEHPTVERPQGADRRERCHQSERQ